MTLCRDCEHFKIRQQPIKGFDWGMAECTKYNLVVDFADRRKFKWLSCEDRPKHEVGRRMTRKEAIKVLSSYDVNGVWNDVDGKPYNAEEQAEAFDMAIEALQADTVEVVRCKDCKHAYKRKPINKTAILCELFGAGIKDNDFCSHGERSEE